MSQSVAMRTFVFVWSVHGVVQKESRVPITEGFMSRLQLAWKWCAGGSGRSCRVYAPGLHNKDVQKVTVQDVNRVILACVGLLSEHMPLFDVPVNEPVGCHRCGGVHACYQGCDA